MIKCSFSRSYFICLHLMCFRLSTKTIHLPRLYDGCHIELVFYHVSLNMFKTYLLVRVDLLRVSLIFIIPPCWVALSLALSFNVKPGAWSVYGTVAQHNTEEIRSSCDIAFCATSLHAALHWQPQILNTILLLYASWQSCSKARIFFMT